MICFSAVSLFFFFNDTATTEIYTLSLHDALPISPPGVSATVMLPLCASTVCRTSASPSPVPSCLVVKYGSNTRDRKSTRLNSSHGYNSYAVFCFKKKKKKEPDYPLHNQQRRRRTD